jgi:hypothetical protein
MVDMDVLVSAVTHTLYERCSSQIPQGRRTTATTIFKSVPKELVVVLCDAQPRLWRKIAVKSTPSRRRVKYIPIE